MADTTGTIQLDALIIGGGVQGLWMLNDLRRSGYQAILLEQDELGGKQTCHSHVYIHQGHLYNNGQQGLVEGLGKANALWSTWLDAHITVRGCKPSYFGFQNPATARLKTELWDNEGLKYEKDMPLPMALQGTSISTLLQSPEDCLDGQSLIENLSAGLDVFMSRIQAVKRITLSGGSQRGAAHAVKEVEVIMPGEDILAFRPAALVLAAGRGNQSLLDLASSEAQDPLPVSLANKQQVRKSHMLVVKGRTLEPLTGVFPELNDLFLVSRQSADGVVWLVSDYRCPHMICDKDWEQHDAQWWLPGMLSALQQLAPRYFGDDTQRQLQWGVYEAPKAEGIAGGNIPHEERIEQFEISNLWTLWPTKLTLAPKVSQRVTEQVESLLGTATSSDLPQAWLKSRQAPATAPELWTKTPLLSWDEFRRCHNII